MDCQNICSNFISTSVCHVWQGPTVCCNKNCSCVFWRSAQKYRARKYYWVIATEFVVTLCQPAIALHLTWHQLPAWKCMRLWSVSTLNSTRPPSRFLCLPAVPSEPSEVLQIHWDYGQILLLVPGVVVASSTTVILIIYFLCLQSAIPARTSCSSSVGQRCLPRNSFSHHSATGHDSQVCGDSNMKLRLFYPRPTHGSFTVEDVEGWIINLGYSFMAE